MSCTAQPRQLDTAEARHFHRDAVQAECPSSVLELENGANRSKLKKMGAIQSTHDDARQIDCAEG
jgi:hypothetical protein